jgi:hypothetical protein
MSQTPSASLHDKSSNDAIHQDNTEMGDGDGYTGQELEAQAASGINQVDSSVMDHFSTFYTYKILPQEENESDADWETRKKAGEMRYMIEDLKLLQKEIGDPPNDLEVGEGKTLEMAQEAWRLEKLVLVKRKLLNHQALHEYEQRYKMQQDDRQNAKDRGQVKSWEKKNQGKILDPVTDDNLETLFDQFETEEEGYGIGEKDDSMDYSRPPKSTDLEWSKRKRELLKEAQKAEESETPTRREHIHKGIKEAAPDGNFSELNSSIDRLKEDIPESIRAIHLTMCVIIFRWWQATESKLDLVNFRKCSERLNILPGSEAYRVAPTEIALWMKRLKDILVRCETLPSEDHLVELAGTAITFTNKLRKGGLDLNMVTGKDTHRRIFRCLFDVDHARLEPLRGQLKDAHLKPRKEQIEKLKQINHVLPVLFKDKTLQTGSLEILLGQIKSINRDVGEQNKTLGVRMIDHQIPTNDLELAIKLKSANQTGEIRSQIAKLAYKMQILGIPHYEVIKAAVSDCNIDQKEALYEVLDISERPGCEPSLVEDIPVIVRAPHSAEFDGFVAKTVAWGNCRGLFFINQYGPRNAPIFRKEPYPGPRWMEKYGALGGPSVHRIPTMGERAGDDISKCGLQHIEGVYGVAFPPSTNSEDPLEPVDPDYHDPYFYPLGATVPRNDVIYVLVGWDINLTRKDVIKRWETRTFFRSKWRKDPDEEIYRIASESQENFESYKRGEIEERDESPEPLARPAADVVRSRSREADEPRPDVQAQPSDRKTRFASPGVGTSELRNVVMPSIEPVYGYAPPRAARLHEYDTRRRRFFSEESFEDKGIEIPRATDHRAWNRRPARIRSSLKTRYGATLERDNHQEITQFFGRIKDMYDERTVRILMNEKFGSDWLSAMIPD